jgi:hypothetical protein
MMVMMKTKTINKIPVLDKGYVGIFSLSVGNDELNELVVSFNLRQPDDYLCLPHVHMAVKCPLFVQLWMGRYQLHMVTKPGKVKEAYYPDESEVKAKTLEVSKEIAGDIKATTEALLINPKAYTYDGCDSHVAQIITPINVYNELMVSGSLLQWLPIMRAKNLPKPIEAYSKAIKNVLEAEWTTLKSLK